MRKTKKFLDFMDRIKTSENESLVESIKRGYSAIFTEGITVKVTLEDGDHYNTKINTDLQGAKDYFLGKMINMGIDGDLMKKVVKVEQI